MKARCPVYWCALVVVFCVDAGAVLGAPGPAGLLIERQDGPNPWTHLDLKNAPGEFRFVIVSDRTGGKRDSVFAAAVDKINLLRPQFVMSIGDLIGGQSEDRAVIARQWDEFQGIVSRLEMPFFFVPGNHDITWKKPAMGNVMAEEWEKRFGRRYYHFVYRNVLFLCLDSQDGRRWGGFGDEQVQYVSQALADNTDVHWTLVFLHQPLWRHGGARKWAPIEALLKDRPYTAFAGHVHSYSKAVRNGRAHYVLSVTGGGSSLHGPAAGKFDHIVWVTMTDDGPRMANLALDGILPDDFVTPGGRQLAARLAGKDLLGASPVYVGPGTFAGGSTRIGVVNPAGEPLKLEARVWPNPSARAVPSSFSLTVPPQSTGYQELKIEALKPAAAEDTTPLLLNWKATCNLPGVPLQQAEGVYPIHFLESEWTGTCPALASPVVVDGKLDEWKEFPLDCRRRNRFRSISEVWKGPGDCSFRFATAHDDSFVYVAIEVTDDHVVADPRGRFWRQDWMAVNLDARSDPLRSWGRGGSPFADFIAFRIGPGVTPDRTVWGDRWRITGEARARCLKTAAGFAAEVAVPFSYLDRAQDGPWKAFRLNVAVFDRDEPDEKPIALWWQPPWSDYLNYAASGTFVRK